MATSDKPIDLAALRDRLAATGANRYWQSLEELAETKEYLGFLHNEFNLQAPEEPNGLTRRQLLKMAAAATALAGLTGCTRLPAEKIVPYVRMPEEIVPGKPLFYATSFAQNGVASGLLVESHMGRPTKVEGNPQHPGSLGATDSFAQASVLTLYDPDRSQTPVHEGRVSDWETFVNAAKLWRQSQLATQGAGLRILTETITSPSLAAQIVALLAEFPQAKWYQWEPCGRDAARLGSQMAFGEYVTTVHRFDRTDVVLSLDADFVCAGPGHVRSAHDFSARRRVDSPSQSQMCRLYVAETTPSNTGSMADHRLPVRANEMEGLAWALAASLGVTPKTNSARGGFDDWARAVAHDLQAHRGASIVIAGDQQPPIVHALVHAMNVHLGNIGRTVVYTECIEAKPTNQLQSLRELTAEMASNRVSLLIIIGANPVFAAPADLDFAEHLLNVDQRVHMGLYSDETANLCNWHIPEAHFLESWGDGRAYDGTVGIVQPLIAPLYQGRSPYELLAALQGQQHVSAHDIVHDYWKHRLAGDDFESLWLRSLHDGLVAGSALTEKSVALRPGWEATARANTAATDTTKALEVTFRPDPTIADGRWANNGWLQELPKPLTKLTWDNAAILSPATAQQFGVSAGSLVTLSLKGREVEAPIWIQPGQADNSVTVHLGYGRERAGHLGTAIGFNAYRIRTSAGMWAATGIQIRKAGKNYPLATTQHQYVMTRPKAGPAASEEEESASAMERNLVRIGTLEEFRKDPHFAQHADAQSPKDLSLYLPFKYEGYAWAMCIDLNSCIGCGACVVACQAENNISVVGKQEVLTGRAMHWIRVDTYYRGGLDRPEIYHEPVPCMQCENAPCEVVCPVGATVHSPEGLNDMVYNRCVGTRYCSNNCPYKVRRFNFKLYSDWTTASLFGLRNPDVTVRSRGVMEKCTYCVQRINAAKITAEEQDRSVADGEIATACQAVCPSQAIMFGNQNDPNSRVARWKAQPRNFSLLADLNTRPRTTYLARLTNPNPDMPE